MLQRYIDGTMTISTGSITDSGGTIDFDNDNLTTTATVTAEQLTTTDDLTSNRRCNR